MPPNKEAVKEELRNITTVNLIASTTNVLEKILWALIAIFGTLFIYDVVDTQLNFWNENPILITRQMIELSEMPLPAMTFCHKGLQKYGSMERLVNLIDSNKKVPKEILALRNEFLKARYKKTASQLGGMAFCSWLFGLKGDQRNNHPIFRNVTLDQENVLQSDCQVSYLLNDNAL